jgi:hypothetical protein
VKDPAPGRIDGRYEASISAQVCGAGKPGDVAELVHDAYGEERPDTRDATDPAYALIPAPEPAHEPVALPDPRPDGFEQDHLAVNSCRSAGDSGTAWSQAQPAWPKRSVHCPACSRISG